MSERYIAHVKKDLAGNWQEPHDLLDHLQSVASKAGKFSSTFGSQDWAHLAGLWHDLGKFKTDFQKYIRTDSGFDMDETNEGGPGRVDHSCAGAQWAIQRFTELYGEGGKPFARILAYLIAGHHAGLPDWNHEMGVGGALNTRLNESRHLLETLDSSPPKEILNHSLPDTPCPGSVDNLHLWIRMLFSCLVDADFLDTETYMNREKSTEREASKPTLAQLKVLFDDYMEEKSNLAITKAPSAVNLKRQEVLSQCRKHSLWEPGVFSLTVPTGGGKTLAGMAFALEHAVKHKKNRVIVAIPYTSIIEQSAEQYRLIFGEDAVIEHHSNLEPDKESLRAKLAAENWDAPIIVTTNVQLFESLFASRTSQCRKLHNIANSVIILDEAQMLPTGFLDPILSCMKNLSQYFGCSIVLSTATQPVLTGRFQSGQAKLKGFEAGTVRELITKPLELSRELKRVEIVQHHCFKERVEWEDLVQELMGEESVLCIVNTRKDCRTLFDLMPPGTIHLSALMCPEHRSEVISGKQGIKNRLKNGEALRVISTQLVEAGVDLDFPVVYRALAGFDSIAQAAGRCNREGQLQGRLGKVVVFKPPKDAPSGLLLKGQYAGEEILRSYPELVSNLDPQVFEHYFTTLYSRVSSFDEKKIMELLAGSDVVEAKIQFRSAAQNFTLIDQKDQVGIVVDYRKPKEDATKSLSGIDLIKELEFGTPSRKIMRKLQRYTVTVPKKVAHNLLSGNYIRTVEGMDRLYVQTEIIVAGLPRGIYDSVYGLQLDGPQLAMEDFIA